MSSPAPAPIIFGESHICKNCGRLARERHRFGVGPAGAAQTWAIEYCEYCRPQSVLAAMADAARPIRREAGQA